jgi:hypothetical protein
MAVERTTIPSSAAESFFTISSTFRAIATNGDFLGRYHQNRLFWLAAG